MRLIFTVTTSILLSLSSYLSAQTPELTAPDKLQNLQLTGDNDVGNTVQTYDGRYEGEKGHPYLYDDWVEGHVLLENEREYQNVMLKPNVTKDELISLQQNKYPIILPKKKVKAFTIGNGDSLGTANFVKARFLNCTLKSVDEEQYVQVLHQGKIALYAINQKELHEADFRGAYSIGERYDEFGDIKLIYYLAGQNDVVKLKNKRKSVLKVLDDKNGLLSNYMQEQKLDPRKQQDLLQLILFKEQLPD